MPTLVLGRVSRAPLVTVPDAKPVPMPRQRSQPVLTRIPVDQLAALLRQWWELDITQYPLPTTAVTHHDAHPSVHPYRRPSYVARTVARATRRHGRNYLPDAHTGRLDRQKERAHLSRRAHHGNLPLSPPMSHDDTVEAINTAGSPSNEPIPAVWDVDAVVRHWSVFWRLPKSRIVKTLSAQVLPAAMTHGQFAELELLAMVDNLHKVRRWRTFQMVRSDEGRPLYHVQDARSMKQLISDHADGVYPIHVSTVDFQDLLLTRVAYYGDTTVDAPPDSKTTAYFGYRPHADYMFLIRGTGIPRTPLFRTLASVFRCATFSAYPLEGKNLTALSHTLLNQATQGPYALYRDYAALAHNPLEHRSQRDDLATEVQLDHGTSDTAARHPVDGTGTVAEDQRQLDRQRVVVVHQLGLDSTATLDRLEFVHTAPLTSSSSSGATAPKESEVPADPVEVTMTVTFRGPDVVGGLRDLVSSGSTTGAYPEFLPTCLGRAANRFSVKVARGTPVRIDTLEKEGGGEAP